VSSILSMSLCHCSLLEASSRRTDIRTALQASPDWQKYVQGPLGEANNRQDVMQWACGRASKETLSTFKSTDDIMIDETDAPEEGSVNRHLMRYNSLEDDDGDVSLPADKVQLLSKTVFPNVELHFHCPQTFWGLDIHVKMDIPELI
jgi:hypothetical protein